MSKDAAVLIGSQALQKQYDKDNAAWIFQLDADPYDWDVVMSLTTAGKWLQDNEEQIGDLEFVLGDLSTYTAPRKMIARLKSGHNVEIEVSDYESSWPMMPKALTIPELCICGSPEVNIQNVQVPSWRHLAALKMLHLFLPVQWQKAAHQLKDILFESGLDAAGMSAKELIINLSDGMDEKEWQKFVHKRMAENYKNFRLLQIERGASSITIPTLTTDQLNQIIDKIEKLTGHRFASGATLLASPKGAAEAVVTEAVTGLKFSREAWWDAHNEDRVRALQDLLGVIAVHLYLAGPNFDELVSRLGTILAMKQSKKKLVSHIWVLSIESLCTNCVAFPAPTGGYEPSHLSESYLKSTTGLYEFARSDGMHEDDDEQEEAESFSLSDLALKIMAVPDMSTDTRSDYELQKAFRTASLQRTVIFSAVFASLPSLLNSKTIPGWFETLCQPLCEAIINFQPPTFNLPHDILRIIAQSVDDHISLSRLSCVNRGFCRAVDDSVWLGLLVQAFGGGCIKKNNSWKSTFKLAYWRWCQEKATPTAKCPTCGERHKKINMAEWRASRQEWKWGWCPCPDCYHRSWHNCAFQSRFEI